MRNVLLLCEAYGGGVKKYIDSIMANTQKFPECNFSVLISSTRLDDDNFSSQYIVDNDISFGKSFMKLYKSLLRLNEIVKKNGINIIHANSSYAGFLSYLYSFLNKKVKIVYTPHGYYSLKNMSSVKKKILRFVERKINSRCSRVIHVSKSEEKIALKNHLVAKEKSIVIYNGVKCPEDIYKKEGEKFIVVNLARVDEQKNPFEFVKIAESVIKCNDHIQFIWAGSGMYLTKIQKMIEFKGFQDKIKFIGHVNNTDDILSKANMYLSTSYYEGLPFSVIEAMSYKLPLILSDIVGHKDLVEQNVNGTLFKLGNINQTAKIIESYVNDKNRLNFSSTNSFTIFKKNFDINVMLGKIRRVYKSIDANNMP